MVSSSDAAEGGRDGIGRRLVLLTQAALGVLLVPAVGLAGVRAFSPRAGLWAAAAAALYPEIVWFSVHFWSETVFMVLLWWGIERLLAADTSDGPGRAVAAGV